MRPPSSSKNPKKNSDDDRSRKKKIKSKSAKRRRDCSISSYSESESDSEIDSTSRRRSLKSKKLEKRRKESKSKKSDKRRSRKKRSRRDSSVSSYSSSDSGRRCPTCSDSERSRSPVRKKSKLRKRDRKSSRLYESKSKSRRRYRSPSCSTCSSGGRSRSRSRRLSHSPSPIDERLRSSRGRSPVAERFGSGRRQSPDEERFVSGSHGQSPVEEMYREEGKRKRLRSVLAVMKPSDEDKIIKAYDDYPSSQTTEVYDEGNKNRDLGDEDGKIDSYDTRIRDEVTLSKDAGRLFKNSNDSGDASLACELRSAKDYLKKNEIESETGGGNGEKETEDLELVLRQKALENFMMFRSRRPANRDPVSDKKDEPFKPESSGGLQSSVQISESKRPNSPDDQKRVKGGAHTNVLKSSSVAAIPIEKNDGSTGSFGPVASVVNNQNIPNHLETVEKSSNKTIPKETQLPTDDQNKRVVAETDGGQADTPEVGTADASVSVAVSTENQNCKSNEPTAETANGSQFEQKTFSRVRDGETVQVTYKVYIPKKSPALARRQLQR